MFSVPKSVVASVDVNSSYEEEDGGLFSVTRIVVGSASGVEVNELGDTEDGEKKVGDGLSSDPDPPNVDNVRGSVVEECGLVTMVTDVWVEEFATAELCCEVVARGAVGGSEPDPDPSVESRDNEVDAAVSKPVIRVVAPGSGVVLAESETGDGNDDAEAVVDAAIDAVGCAVDGSSAEPELEDEVLTEKSG